MKKMLVPGLFALATFVAACGGGGGGTSSVPSTGGAHAQAVPVSLRVNIPAASVHANAKVRARMNAAHSTQGFQVSVNTAPVTTVAFDMRSSNTTQCVTNADFSYTCTFTVNVAPGTYTFSYSSYDAAPVGGTIPVAANKLGIGSQSIAIVAGAANALGVVLNGIATGVAVSLPIGVVHTVNPLAQQATIAVLDADNDLIVTNSYVDSSGNPITVNLTSSCPLVTVSPAAISSPLPSGATVSYSPTNLTANEMTAGATSTILATLSSGPTGAAYLSIPAPLQPVVVGAQPQGIAAQGTSTLWVTEPSANNIQSFNTIAHSTFTYPVASSAPIGPTPGPYDILYGPDGNLWLTFQNTGALGRISTSGTNEVAALLPNVGTSLATDGTNIWTVVPTANKIAWTATSPFNVQTFTNVANAGYTQIALGNGGVMWYTASIVSQVDFGAAPSPGPISNLPLAAGAQPQGIAWDGSSTVYATEPSVQKMAVLTGAPPGVFLNEYSTGVSPFKVAVGSDGNAWFDYQAPTGGIGRITPAGVVTLYPLPIGVVPGEMVRLGTQVWVVDTASTVLYGISP
jgi:streptogramin lyase